MNLLKMKLEAVKDESTPPPGGGQPGTGIDVPPENPEDVKSFQEDIDDLFSDEEDVDSSPPAPAAPTPAPTPEVAPPTEPAPVVEPQPAPTVEEPVHPQPTAPVVPEAPTAPVAPAAPVDLVEQRNAAQTALEKRYALTQEDADAMISEPEKVLPRLVAKVYLDLFEDMMRNVQTFLPQAVQNIQQYSSVQQRDEAEFYDKWKPLAQHKKTVEHIGQVYRGLNPQATKEQFINDVGLQAMIHLKLPIDGYLQSTPPAPVPSAPSAPYTPPQGGAVSTPPAPPAAPLSGFEALAQEWEELDKF